MTWLATVHGAFGVKWSSMLEVLLVRRRMFETRARSSKSLESLAVWSERFKNGPVTAKFWHTDGFVKVSLGKFQ